MTFTQEIKQAAQAYWIVVLRTHSYKESGRGRYHSRNFGITSCRMPIT